MTKPRRPWWLLGASVLAVASACGLVVIGSGETIPSAVRNPVARFVDPGISVWSFVFGGPFQSWPRSPGGIAFAAVSNALLWLIPVWALAMLVRWVRRTAEAPRP